MLLFTTGTLTEASAAALGATMQSKIRDDLGLHPAWELVEEFTPSGGAVNWLVMKCLASASGLSQDYFVVIARNISSGELRIFISENYNTSTKVVQYYVPYFGGAGVTYDSLGRNSATFTLGTAVMLVTGSHSQPQTFQSFFTPSTTTKFWIIASDDGFTVAFNGSHNKFIHVSAYIPLATLQSDLPIGMCSTTSGGSGADGGITRNPAAAGLGAGLATGLTTYGGGSPFTSYTPGIGWWDVNISPAYNDKLNDNKRGLLSEIGVVIYPNNPSTHFPIYGYALGKQTPRFRFLPGLTGTVWGDTVTYNGTLWIQYLPGLESRIWDTGVAA